MKHNYTFLLSLRRTLSAMMLLLVSTLSWADSFDAGGIYYYINEDGTSVTVASCQREYSGHLVIPSTVVHDDKTYKVTDIDNEAFRYCKSLTSIVIPDGVTSIGWFAFKNCTSLASAVIGNGMTDMKVGTFMLCTSLTTVDLPESLTSIRGEAFRSCKSLTSITIPEGVTFIEEDVFDGCTSLATVVCRAGKVPDAAMAFGDAPLYKATLYVPSSSIEAYKAADQWKNFGKILSLEDYETGIALPTAPQDNTSAPYYTTGGQRVAAPARGGMYIHKGRKVIVR